MILETRWEYHGRITIRDTKDYRITSTLRSVEFMGEKGDIRTKMQYKTYKWHDCHVYAPDRDNLPVVKKV